VFEAVIRVKAIYSVSQKNVTMLNNFNKLEPISVFLHRGLATNHNYIFLLNLLWIYFTLQYLTVA